jgi:hypothetical protein
VQVRVEKVEPGAVTLATLEGHPLAGIVRFSFADETAGAIRFTIEVVERPASRIDQISMALVGSAAQKRTWMATAERVCEHAGARCDDGVAEDSWSLDDEEAAPFEEWVLGLIQERERKDRAAW